MSESLYKKNRPTTLKGIRGQPEAVKVLQGYFANGGPPHALLFTGPSGTGKTTLARIVRDMVGCSEGDYAEINCATVEKPLDMVRDIDRMMRLSPMSGSCRFFFLEEAQSLKRSDSSQQALLKMLEDTPKHVYFVLATTDPSKLINTIHTRCTEIKLGLLPPKEVKALVEEVAKKEKATITSLVAERITEMAEGSARKALVLLESVLPLPGEEEQLSVILSSDSKKKAIDLARAVMAGKGSWTKISTTLKELDEEEETVRRLVLGYANSVLLGGGKMADRAYLVIRAFQYPFFDSGRAGLTAACWEVAGK